MPSQTESDVIMIDSTVIRAHPCAAGYEKGDGSVQGLGCSNGGYSTKIHLVIDELGTPLVRAITKGKRSDMK
jgi:hypothetical protein